MEEAILKEWKRDSKPAKLGTTYCIELQKDERWGSELPFTVDGVLHYHSDCPFYPGAFRPLKEVDRTPNEIEEVRKLLGTHRSEPGWNLPRNHRCHLLNFPKEVLKMIFAYTLVAKGGAFVTPTVVTSNDVESYSEADHRISFPDCSYYNTYKSFESGSDMTLRKNVDHVDGIPGSFPHVELTRVLRPLIDATCLRTCKEIREFGSQMLYTDNSYSFKMIGNRFKYYDNPPSLFFEDGDYYWPSPNKPILPQEGISDGSTVKSLSARQYQSEIESVINQIESRVPIFELEGWAYYDPFLRFLYTIGPESRASLRTLRFTGAPKTHAREAEGCHCHGVDLLDNIRLYIPFINKFCTGLKKLVLDMDMDVCTTMGSVENVIKRFDEVLKPFLGELEKLQRVRILVMRRRISPTEESLRRSLFEDIDYAKDTISYFRSRVENKS
ncbi:hypothetical protein EAE96_001362 [Botrytis aclada]|nr:hypothetical protein EAE96_001362 [Botrytis aclada]